MKKTISLILSVLLCLGLLPAAALADADPSGEPAEAAVAAEAAVLDGIAEETEDNYKEENTEAPAEADGADEPADGELPVADTPAEEPAIEADAAPIDSAAEDEPAAADEDVLTLLTDKGSLTESDVRAKLQELLASYPAGSSWNTSFHGAIQCYGFAMMIVNNVFGLSSGYYRSWAYDGTSSSGMYRVATVEVCTEESVKELFSKARPGDVLQFNAGASGHQHSMIFFEATENGAIIYENNWYGSNVVSLTTLTWAQFAQRQYESGSIGGAKRRGALSLVRADNYDVSQTSEGVTASLSIYGTQYPAGRLEYGASFPLRGVISSGTLLTNVSAWIYDAAGTAVLSYSKNPNAASYNIQTGGLDDTFLFGKLARGSYRYVVAATDGVETKTLIDSEFYVGEMTSYTVTYDSNGGSGAPPVQSKGHGEALRLADIVPLRDGYNFLGWAESADANTPVWQPGDTYDADASLRLYAVWEVQYVTLPSAPIVSISADGSAATVSGQTDGLYARISLVLQLEGTGQSGLYVTQSEIGEGGTISLPTSTFSVPGITVVGVSISLVSRVGDISSPTPEPVVANFLYL